MYPWNSLAYHSGVNILALDTATEACSAALLREDGCVFSEFEIAPRQHTRLLPRMMDAVIAAAAIDKRQLTHCAFSNGPGAFTGIRIAAAQAQGIGIALGIPLVPVSTLAVLAQVAFDRGEAERVLVALDARMQEVYWAVYNRDASGLAELDEVELLSPIGEVRADDRVDYGCGHGWLDELRARVAFPTDPGVMPTAEALLRLGASVTALERAVAADRIGINYLRNRVAEKTSPA